MKDCLDLFLWGCYLLFSSFPCILVGVTNGVLEQTLFDNVTLSHSPGRQMLFYEVNVTR